MIMNIIYSFSQGLQLGATTIIISNVLDNTVSSRETIAQMKKDENLYTNGLQANYINLLLIGPIYYIVVYNWLTNPDKEGFYPMDYVGIVFIHNLLYFIAHFLMHTVPYLKDIHNFHHKFQDVIPSNGNAVSVLEFNFAYVIPFVIGALLLKPNNLTFKLGVSTISILNTMIHTPAFKNLRYVSMIVTPYDHMMHHQTRTHTYSAPLLNFDYFMKELYVTLGYWKQIVILKYEYFKKSHHVD